MRRVATLLLLIAPLAAGRTGTQSIQAAPGTIKINQRDGLTYMWIPPSAYRMGCQGAVVERSFSDVEEACLGNELPRHSVTLSRGFWLGKTLVTQSVYRRLMRSNPSKFRGDQLPVDNASWDEARTYCERVGMRLPTEAEWEYAARGGAAAERYGLLDRIAWYRGNSGGKTHPVAQKQPNGYGLYDMMGNVWEWASDWYRDYPKAADGSCCDDPSAPLVDPKGPSSGQYHVLRGGSWNDFSADVRVALRDHPKLSPLEDSDRDYDNYSVGFRCAGD
jgi:formylglycine-generating enzyme required for sulfatase activity